MAAKNLKPSIVQQFAIFVREQVHMQASQTHASGESSVDLVSYVEFQKNQRWGRRLTLPSEYFRYHA